MNRHVRALLLVFSMCLTTFAAGSAAQAPAVSTEPTFDVVSIKRSDPSATGGGMRIRPDGQLTMTNQSLRSLLGAAYPGTVEYVGLPEWMFRERYDVIATPPSGTPREQLAPMWRALFAERLHMAAHTETRDQTAFALVLARNDGRPGPGMRPSTLDCEALAAAFRAREQQSGRAEPPSMSNAAERCGLSMGQGTMVSGSVSMPELAQALRGLSGRSMVVDKTGLSGRYAVSLTFGMPRQPSPDAQAGAAADAPSIFTALREQLGLKLDPTEASIQVLVIERIERPTEN